MIAHDMVEKAVNKAYDKGRIRGRIEAYEEMSDVIEFYTRAILTALDAQIEELQKKQQ